MTTLFGERILIVDDDALTCQMLAGLLSHEGYRTLTAISAAQALDLMAFDLPDLILLDALMPGVSGFELAGQLKQDERTRNIPIIMVTALNDADSRLAALERGAEEYLVKPVQRLELVVRVRNLLKLKKYQDWLEKKSESDALEHSKRLEAANARLGELQGQLLQSEKLASIGQMAAGVAHEINNPIGFVSSNFSTLKVYVDQLLELISVYEESEAGLSAPVRERLQAMKAEMDFDYLREDIRNLLLESQDGIVRVRKIVQDLKDFSRTTAGQEWVYADLRQCLESTLTIVNNEIKYKADVCREWGNIPDIECLPGQLNQVFLNLLVNAAQAMPEGKRGVITVRTGCDEESVWVEVADNGSGMAPEVRAKIFEPFYTTKPVGVGTGLGLSVSFGIVQRHGGAIEVSSELGVGTTFRVILPRNLTHHQRG